MSDPDAPGHGPPLSVVSGAFTVYEVARDGDRILYYGDPQVPPDAILEQLWPEFRRRGYDLQFTTRHGEYVLVAEPVELGVDGIPWTNVLLFVATIASTLFAGTLWYHVQDPFSVEVLRALPFTLAILFVLGVHELGHYVMSRYHGVDASLPYFIPVPSLIGTMGAVIRMKGQMPSRKALFDIGVAGPLAGLVATVVVTVVGLYLPPVSPCEPGTSQAACEAALQGPEYATVVLGYPPLIEGIAWLTGQPLEFASATLSVNPVVVAAWVGALITFLNLLPVGQLDGGHIMRAMLGERQETVAAAVPLLLFALVGYLWYVATDVPSNAIALWGFWGLFSLVFAFVGPAKPINDESLDARRMAVGVFTFLLGGLCFALVPITIIP